MTATPRNLNVNPPTVYRVSLVLGSTEVPLSQDDCWLSRDWVPSTPDRTIVSTAVQDGNGDRITGVTRRNVVETLPLLMWADSRYATTQLIQQIESLILKAERYWRTGQGDKLYLTFWPRGGRKHRSEIYTGSLSHERGTMRVWGEGRHAATLQLTRAWYWEEPTERELPLVRAGDAAATGGVRVDNDYDPGNSKYNYVTIGGASILGSSEVPTPVRLKLLNNIVGSQLSIRDLYIGKFAISGTSVSAFIHTLQGESISDQAGGSTQADANSSAAFFQRWALSATATRLGYWTIGSTRANSLAGGMVQIMARFANTTGYDTAFPRIYFTLDGQTATGFPLLRTPDIALSGRKLDAMGTIAIPPGIPWLQEENSLYLNLWGYRTDAVNLDLDYIQLFPTESFRAYQQFFGAIANGGAIHDDGYRVWTVDGSGFTQQVMVPAGSPIMLSPGIDNRLFFLFDEASLAMNITRALTVSAFYRPRVLSFGI